VEKPSKGKQYSHSAIADVAYIMPRAMQINRNKYISTNKINVIDQHNYITNFAYIPQTTEINIAKHDHVTNNSCVLPPPQISTSTVDFSYGQPKFCKQPLVGTDNPQK